jgi:WD40 repeat protein/serine/threonine protein kinase
MVPQPAAGAPSDQVRAELNRFKEQWDSWLRADSKSHRPNIEQAIRNLDVPPAYVPLTDFLAVEIDYRRKAGEEPAVSDYLTRFPRQSESIELALRGTETQALTNPEDLSPTSGYTIDADKRTLPQTIGKYRVERPLGSGGQATTYLVYDPDLEKRVVVKRYHTSVAGTEHFVRQEGRALARVDSDYVARCLALEHIEDQFYLVMEYIRGEQLDEYYRTRRPSFEELASLLARVAEGLCDVHDVGLLHCDIKPANIVVRKNGMPCLVDFGVAVRVGSGTLEMVGGTLPYMSPEQANEDWESLGQRSDVFGLGAVLYALLTGRPPYVGQTRDQVVERAKKCDFIPPSQLNPDVPRDLERICLKAMSPNLANRYRSAALLQSDLKRFSGRPKDRSTAKPQQLKPQALGTNPYRGLTAFTEQDADLFFGREEQIERLREAFRQLHSQDAIEQHTARILPILGPSGSGKSSLARAGLVATLARRPIVEDRAPRTIVVIPGAHPLETLATAFARLATNDPSPIAKAREFEEQLRLPGANGQYDGLRRLVNHLPDVDKAPILLVIDQFEEVHTLCADPRERATLIDGLIEAASDPTMRLSAVLTLRTDFLGETQDHKDLSAIIAARGMLVPVMSEDELRQAIAAPAARSGYDFDPAVVALLVDQSRGREGVLPLLQFALVRIWEGLRGGVDPATTLKQIGGVGGALAGEAQRIYDGLTVQDQELARRIFLGLVQLGEGTRDTRRRAPLASLVSHAAGEDRIRSVIERFSGPGARLITLSADERGEETVEITHEALFDHWKTLNGWLDASRGDIRLHRRLEEATAHWQEKGRPAGLLWRSPDLDILREFATRAEKDLTAGELDFYRASDALQQEEVRAQRRRMRAYKVAAGVFAVMTIAVIALALHANNQASIASQEYERAKEETGRANQAVNDLKKAKDLADDAKKVAIAEKQRAETEQTRANEERGRAETQAQLAQQRLEETQRVRYRDQIEAAQGELASRPAAALAILENPANCPEHLREFVWGYFRQQCDREVRTLFGHREFVWTVKFSPDGRTLATAAGGIDTSIKLWDVETWTLRRTLRGHDNGNWELAFSPDSTVLASCGSDEVVKLWDVATGAEKGVIPHGAKVMTLTFSPDGELLATGDFDGLIRVWRINDPAESVILPSAHLGIVRRVRFSPDGKLLLSCGDDHHVCLWDLETKKGRWREDCKAITYAVAFPPSGDTVLVGAGDAIQFRTLETGELVDALRGHDSATYGLEISKDGKWLASASYDKRVILWNLETKKQIAVIGEHAGFALGLDISPDQSLIASGGSDEAVVIWRTAVPPHEDIPAAGKNVVASPRGKLLGLIGAGGEARLVEAATMRERSRWAVDLRHDRPLVFSPDEQHVAIMSGDSHLASFTDEMGASPDTRPLPRNVTVDQKSGASVAVSPDGKQLVTVDWNGQAIAYDTNTGATQWKTEPIQQQLGSRRFVVDYSADSSHLVLLQTTAPGEARLRYHYGATVLEARTGESIPLELPQRSFTAIALSSDASEVAIAFTKPGGHELLGWSRSQGQYRQRGPAAQQEAGDPAANQLGRQIGKGLGSLLRGGASIRRGPIQRMAFQNDGRRLALVDTFGNLTIQDVETWKPLDFRAMHPMASAVRITPDGKEVISCGIDGLVRVWSLEQLSDKPLRELRLVLQQRALRVSIVASAAAIRALNQDESISTFDAATGKQIAHVEIPGAVAGSSGFNAGHTLRLAFWMPKAEIVPLTNTPDGKPITALSGDVTGVCFSPDSGQLALESAGGIEIWDLSARKVRRRIEGMALGPLEFALARDWTRLVTTSDGGAHLQIWDLTTDQSVTAAGARQRFISASLSADGAFLAAAEAGDSKIRVWRLVEFNELPPLSGHTNSVFSVRFLDDGKTLASTDGGNRLKLWDIETWQEQLNLHVDSLAEAGAPQIELNSFDLERDRGPIQLASRHHCLIVRPDPTTVQVWNTATRRLRAVLNDGGEPVVAVTLSPDGRIALLSHENGTLTLWDLDRSLLVRRLGSPTNQMLTTAFSADGRTLAAVTDQGKSVELWDPIVGALLHRIAAGEQPVLTPLGFTPDNQRLFVGGQDDSLRLWAAEYGPLVGVQSKGILALALDRKAERLALADDRGMIVIARVSDGAPLHAIPAHRAAIRGVAFSPDGAALASAGDDESCRLWDVETGEPLRSFRHTRGRLAGVTFSPNGEYVAAPHFRGITLWKSSTDEIEWSLDASSLARAIAFSPDSKRAIAAESLPGLRIWTLGTAGSARPTATRLGGHNSGALCAIYSPDGEWIATGGADGKICLWPANPGEEPSATLDAHNDWVHSLAFSADGKYLVSAGADEKLCLWDVAGRKKLQSLASPGGPQWSIAWIPETNQLITAGKDGVARIWNLRGEGDQATIAAARSLQDFGELVRALQPRSDKDDANRPPDETIERIEVAVEEPAVRLVTRLFDELLLVEDVAEAIRQDESLPDAVRKRALILAKRRRADPETLNGKAWTAAVVPGRTAAEYEQALRLIETACRLAPENGMYVNTLGVAQYRCGKYTDAIATLTKSAELNRTQYGSPAPHDLAFMAMAHAQSGQHDQAAASLAQAQTIVARRSFPFGGAAELTAVLNEAAQLVAQAKK